MLCSKILCELSVYDCGAGVCSFLKEGKAGHSLILSLSKVPSLCMTLLCLNTMYCSHIAEMDLRMPEGVVRICVHCFAVPEHQLDRAEAAGLCLQYMVVYQCIVALSSNISFFMDGSSFSAIQVSIVLQTLYPHVKDATIFNVTVCCASMDDYQLCCTLFMACVLRHAYQTAVQALSPIIAAQSYTHVYTHNSAQCQPMFMLQNYAIDFQAISMAFAATIVPPLRSMSRHRPPPLIRVFPNYVLIGMMLFLFTMAGVANMVFMSTRDWFHGGNGTADKASWPLLTSRLFLVYGVCV